MKTEYFESVELSDMGKKRKNNEDACLRIPEKQVFCIADGMGGQAAGDLASEAIITAMQQVFSKAAPEEDRTLARRIALFRKGANQASKWIKDFSDEKVLGQMGSTLVGLIIDPRNPERAVGLHAGDSRLYRYRAGVFEQLTADHSAVAALAAKLGCDPESIPAKYQNELLRCVGLTPSVELEKTPVDVQSNDLFLICSDGLTKMLPDKIIAKILNRSAKDPIGKVAHALIDGANEAGGKDNVTVILVRVGDISGASKVIDALDEEESGAPEADTASPADEAENPLNNPADGSGMRDTSEAYQGETPQTDEDDTPQKEPNPGQNESGSSDASSGSVAAAGRRDVAKGKRYALGIGIAAAVLVAAGAGSLFLGHQNTNNTPAVSVAAQVANKQSVAAPSAIPSPLANPASTAIIQVQPGNPKGQIDQVPTMEAQGTAIAKDSNGVKGQAEEASRVSLTSPSMPAPDNNAQIQKDLAAAEAKKAKEQLEIQEAYSTAIASAQRAYGSGDFKNAASLAAEALEAVPGDVAAARMRENALQMAAAEELNRKYETALKEGQEATEHNDYVVAIAKAKEALDLRPNDKAATLLESQSQVSVDLEAAHAYLDKGDYEEVTKFCSAHPGIDAFTELEKISVVEQGALLDARRHFDAGEYQLVRQQLERQPYRNKPPFLKISNEAKSEWETLGELEDKLRDANDWQAVLDRLADPASAEWVGKPPFRNLAARAARQKEFARLNSTFETMLVEFDIKSPADPYIETPEGRQARKIEGTLSQAQRDKYLETLRQLENDYDRGGWLEENNREKYINKLRDIIVHHQ